MFVESGTTNWTYTRACDKKTTISWMHLGIHVFLCKYIYICMYSVCVCASIFKFSTSTSISLLCVYSNLIWIFVHVHLPNASTSLIPFCVFQRAPDFRVSGRGGKGRGRRRQKAACRTCINGIHPSENSPVVLLHLPKSIKIPRPMHQKCWTVTPQKKNAMPKTCYSLFPASTRTNSSLIFQVHKHPDPTTTTNCNCTATAPCPNRRHKVLHPLGRTRRILHGWGLEQGVHPI